MTILAAIERMPHFCRGRRRPCRSPRNNLYMFPHVLRFFPLLPLHLFVCTHMPLLLLLFSSHNGRDGAAVLVFVLVLALVLALAIVLAVVV